MKRKLTHSLSLLALTMSVICFTGLSCTDAQAVESTELAYTEFEELEDYALATCTGAVAKTYIGKETPIISTEGYLFAGWFTGDECTLEQGVKTSASVTDNGTYYAKFVPEGVLSVKAQVSTQDVNPTESVEARNIRFVSSVDSLNYSKVGFKLAFVDENGNITDTKTSKSTDVFKRISSATAGDEYNFAPKVIDTKSEHLMTATWKGTDNTGVNVTDTTGFHVKAYWTTLDGRTVYGQSRYVTISQGLTANSNIINMSIEKGNLSTGSPITVICGDADVTSVSGSVIYTDDTYAHIVINLGTQKRNELKSATTFTIKDESGNTTLATEVYRNFFREATLGTADTSWWNNTDTEFVIASAADLYGLAQQVNGKKDYFGNASTGLKKTIYLVKDITLNSGTIVSNGALAVDASTLIPWIPIASVSGTYFRGVFDGQGCTISGIYMSSDAANSGLFSHTTAITEIRNVKLDNSYFESSTNFVGSITGKAQGGIFESIYCGNDVLVTNTAGSIGGIMGGAQNNGGTISVNNCWFAGTVKADKSGVAASKIYCGGIVGNLVQGTLNISNCLNTGTVNYVYGNHSSGTQLAVGGVCGGTQNATSYLNMSYCFNSGSVSAGTLSDMTSYTTGVRGLLGYGLVPSDGLDSQLRWNFSNCYVEKDVCPAGAYACNQTGSAYLKTQNVGVVSKSETSEYSIQGHQSYTSPLSNLGLYANCNSESYTEDSRPYWVVNEDGMPTLKDFTTDWIDVGWYYENMTDGAKTYAISTAEEMYGLSAISQDGQNFAGDTIQLEDNIDVNSAIVSVCAIASPDNNAGIRTWTPIGSDFAGTFDGNNKTIKGVYVNTTNANGGFFAKTDHGSTVKNFRFVDSYIYVNNTTGEVGSIAGYGAGTFENIYSNAIVVGNGYRVGGIIGRFQDDEYAANTSYATGEANGWIKQCWFDGTVEANASSTYAGGVLAGVQAGKVEMSNCLNTGKISSSGYAAGLCNGVMNSAYLIITDSVGAGTITCTGQYIGSVVGRVTGTGGLGLTRVFATKESNNSKYITNVPTSVLTGSVTGISEDDITITQNNNWVVNISGESVGTITLGTCGRK